MSPYPILDKHTIIYMCLPEMDLSSHLTCDIDCSEKSILTK